MSGRRAYAYDRMNSTGENAGVCHDQWRGSGEMFKLEAVNVD